MMFNRKEYMKQYCLNNEEKILKRNKQWRKNNRERYKGRQKQWRENNPEYMKEYGKKYSKGHKKERNEYNKNRCKTNLEYNLNHRMTGAIGRALKGNKTGRKWETLVGYTLEDLIERLKSTLPKGYTWQDYLSGKLHIDHIIPKSVFNYTKPEHPDFRRCWALDNLQLLPAKENIIKDIKLNKPFQPALQIC